MWKISITCLLGFASLLGDQEYGVQSFLSYEEWRELTTASQDKEDCIVLVDGTRIPGALSRVPAIKYNFVRMEFDVNDIKTIAVLKTPAQTKIQYITREGQNYIGSIDTGKFAVWVHEPALKDPSHIIEKEIDPAIVNFVVIANRAGRVTHTHPKLGSLELSNGDQLPIVIMSTPITLTDGWIDKKLRSEDLLEVAFDGGLHGKMLVDGTPKPLNFMYVKDPYILVQIPRNQCLVKLPWSQIKHIQAYNGGFRQQDTSKTMAKTTYFEDDFGFDEVGSRLIGYQTIIPDCLGVSKGDLLNDAICTATVAPDAIAEVQRLGLEALVASDILFDANEDFTSFAGFYIRDLVDEDVWNILAEAALWEDYSQITGEELIKDVPSIAEADDVRMELDDDFALFDAIVEPLDLEPEMHIAFEEPEEDPAEDEELHNVEIAFDTDHILEYEFEEKSSNNSIEDLLWEKDDTIGEHISPQEKALIDAVLAEEPL